MKIIGICGHSGSGKTTLLKKLIPQLKSLNIRLAVIKHCHHNVDIDTPGKDSYELRQSGADQIIVASDNRWALITETPNNNLNLDELAAKFAHVDLVLVEGFKNEAIPKIVCYRANNSNPIFYDNHIIAIASDIAIDTKIPQLDINDVFLISKFIERYLITGRPQ